MPRRPHVLIIDDDPLMAALIELHLDAQGYRIDIASDGAAGLAQIRRDPPDAVILDTSMPLLDGHQVLQALQRDPELAAIPVLMLTASKQEQDVKGAFRLGARDYLVKPFKTEDLVARVVRILQ
jgi:DNA-binding response OmpR family regulator